MPISYTDKATTRVHSYLPTGSFLSLVTRHQTLKQLFTTLVKLSRKTGVDEGLKLQVGFETQQKNKARKIIFPPFGPRDDRGKAR